MHKKLIFLILLMCLVLTGCWDKLEIEDRAQVSVIGIDKFNPEKEKEKDTKEEVDMEKAKETKMNKFNFTFAFPKQSLEEVENIVVATVGDSIYSVSRILADRINKELFLGHLRTVILGVDVAKDERLFREILDGMENNELLSRRVVMAITDESAADIVNIKPDMNPRVGQFISELFRRRDKTPRAPEGSLGDILKSLHENKNAVIPRITPGKADVKVAGSAIIKNYQFIGWLEETETAHLMIFKGEQDIVGGTAIDYKGYSVPIDLRPKKPKMKLIQSENNIKIEVEIEGEADVKQTHFEAKEDMLKAETIEEIEKLYCMEMNDRINTSVEKIQKQFKTDVLGIDEYLRQYHYDFWKSVEDDWEEIFPNIDIEVKTNVKIRRIGLVR